MGIEVQGHRCAGKLAPENTLAAVALASKIGVASVEFDVRRTKDAVLVITHGPEYAISAVERCTWEELQAADLGDGQRVPTLEALVDACLQGHVIMNCELKPPPNAPPSGEGSEEQVVKEVLAVLASRSPSKDPALDGCLRISSFSRSMLTLVMSLAPTVPVGALYNHSLGGPGNRAPSPPDFATWFPVGRRPLPGDSVNLCQESATVEEIAAARAAGKAVMLWYPSNAGSPELDDAHEPRCQAVLALRPDVVCSNRPDLFLKLLAKE